MYIVALDTSYRSVVCVIVIPELLTKCLYPTPIFVSLSDLPPKLNHTEPALEHLIANLGFAHVARFLHSLFFYRFSRVALYLPY